MSFQLTAAQRKLADQAMSVAASFRDEARAWDESDEAPYAEISKRIDAAGLLGVAMPKQYGGRGGDAVDYLIVVESLFRGSQSWLPPEPVFATSGPGPAMLLLGEQPVRDRYLPGVVAGERACNIALTEPNAGSALTHLETTARDDGDSYIVNGTKNFVTGSNINGLNATFVRYGNTPGAKGVGALLIDAQMDGVEVERGPTFIGDRGIDHGDLILTDVRVPKENVIAGAGQFARLMTAFNLERLHNTGFWLGFCGAAYDEAAAYAQRRKIFGRTEVEFQSVYHALADMSVQIEALRLLAFRAAASAAEGRFPQPLEVSQAKLFGATVGPQITLKALELHGGYGVTTDYPIQRIHRDCVTNVVAGGAPAVLRNGIAAGLFPDRRFPQAPGPQEVRR